MPSIAEELALTTVRLEGRLASGSTVGTGFLFEIDQRVFVITNKHVVQGVIAGEFQILRMNQAGDGPELGSATTIAFNASNFLGHPDPQVDVAAMNISPQIDEAVNKGAPLYFRTLGPQHNPTVEHFEKFIGPLEDIVFVGYPSGIWDSVNISPITRRGMTATPCYINFNGNPTFLIDASVFPGSSGSPVFIYYQGSHADKEGALYAGNRVHFLGLVAQVYQRQQEGDIKVVNIPTAQRAYAQYEQMIDLGVVFKWHTVTECITEYLRIASAKNTAGYAPASYPSPSTTFGSP